MRFAVFEMEAYGNRQASFIEKCDAHFDSLKGRAVDIVLFPELCTMPYVAAAPNWQPSEYALEIDDPLFEKLRDYARRFCTAILFPFPERQGDCVYNSVAKITPSGETQVVYRKIHLPDGKYANEHNYFTKGDLGVKPTLIAETQIGMAICYDRYFPEQFRMMAAKGAKVAIVTCAASGSAKDTWTQLGVAHAVTNRIFYICTNRCGAESMSDRPFFGGSFAVDPWGKLILPVIVSEDPRTLIFEIDLLEIERARKAWPFLDQWKDIWSVSLK